MTLKSRNYIHGYNKKESERLYRQAQLIYHHSHSNLPFQQKMRLLEVGVGVGAQTALLLKDFPNIHVTAIDCDEGQIQQANAYLATIPWATWPNGEKRYECILMDAMDLQFKDTEKFDGAYLCYILEHVPDPLKVLLEIQTVLKPNSPISCFEEVNETVLFYPSLPHVMQCWYELNRLQNDYGCDGNIGVRLGNLLQIAGFQNINCGIRTFHYDDRNPLKKAEFFHYFKDILLTCTSTLLETGRISQNTYKEMLNEIDFAASDPESAMIFFNMHAVGHSKS